MGMAAGAPVGAGVMIVSASTIISGPTDSQGQPILPEAGSERAGLQVVTVTGQAGQAILSEAGSGPMDSQGVTVIGQGGLALSGAIPAAPGNLTPTITFSSGLVPAQAMPQKVAVTEATKIYHDVTPMGQLPAGGHQTIQQTLEAGSLDELTEHALVTVWGHRDGEQLVADVIMYQDQFPH